MKKSQYIIPHPCCPQVAKNTSKTVVTAAISSSNENIDAKQSEKHFRMISVAVSPQRGLFFLGGCV